MRSHCSSSLPDPSLDKPALLPRQAKEQSYAQALSAAKDWPPSKLLLLLKEGCRLVPPKWPISQKLISSPASSTDQTLHVNSQVRHTARRHRMCRLALPRSTQLRRMALPSF